MPSLVTWLLPQRVIIVTSSGVLTPNDHQRTSDALRMLIEQSTAPISIVCDCRDLVWVRSIATASPNLHSYYGWLRDAQIDQSVIIGQLQPPECRLLMAILQNLDIEVSFTDSLQATLDVLHKHDATLLESV